MTASLRKAAAPLVVAAVLAAAYFGVTWWNEEQQRQRAYQRYVNDEALRRAIWERFGDDVGVTVSHDRPENISPFTWEERMRSGGSWSGAYEDGGRCHVILSLPNDASTYSVHAMAQFVKNRCREDTGIRLADFATIPKPLKGDIRGLIADPRFKKLSYSDKRDALKKAGAPDSFIAEFLAPPYKSGK